MHSDKEGEGKEQGGILGVVHDMYTERRDRDCCGGRRWMLRRAWGLFHTPYWLRARIVEGIQHEPFEEEFTTRASGHVSASLWPPHGWLPTTVRVYSCKSESDHGVSE